MDDTVTRQFRLADAEPVRRDRQFHLQGQHDQGSHGRRGSGSSSGSVGDGSVLDIVRKLGLDVRVPSIEQLSMFDPVPGTDVVESTLIPHVTKAGKLAKKRQVVHDALIADALTDDDGNLFPSQERPVALMMGGGAASGKSTAIKAGHVDSPSDAVTVNPDEFKVLLPEAAGPSSDGKQGDGLADKYGPAWASIAHEESSHLAKRLTSAALEQQTNILIDKTSSNGPKAVAEIRRLQESGYDVQVAFVTTEVEQAVANASSRAAKTGRHVPLETLREGHDGANAAYLDVATQTSVKAKLVTTEPQRADGSYPDPILTAESDGNGGVIVHDRTAWDAYIARVPNPPANLVTYDPDDDALAATAGRVARGGTMNAEGEVMREVIPDDRMKTLYAHAMKGTTPKNMTARERAYLEKTTAEIAEMRENGTAFDFPINDIFDDLDYAPKRKFKAPS